VGLGFLALAYRFRGDSGMTMWRLVAGVALWYALILSVGAFRYAVAA
jgi:hypothetical protein